MTSTNTPRADEPLADSVAVTARRLGCCVAQIYNEINAHRLVARKAGRRTLIERTEQARWIAALPEMRRQIDAACASTIASPAIILTDVA